MKTILGILVILGAFFGAYQYNENRYALNIEFVEAQSANQQAIKNLAISLDQKILYDRLKEIRAEIYMIEDRCRKAPMDQRDRDRLRKLQEEKIETEKQLDSMKAKQIMK